MYEDIHIDLNYERCLLSDRLTTLPDKCSRLYLLRSLPSRRIRYGRYGTNRSNTQSSSLSGSYLAYRIALASPRLLGHSSLTDHSNQQPQRLQSHSPPATATIPDRHFTSWNSASLARL
jgi:hypothetical protein